MMRSAAAMALVAATTAISGMTTQSRAAERTADFSGVWDLTWQTDEGALRKGDMEIAQSGSDLTLTIHGKSDVKARGRADGNNLFARGSRFLISYSVVARMEGSSMAGSLKIMSSEKRFTAQRRER